MPAFTGQLNTNAIFAMIYNMIISQIVFADNIGKHQDLVDEARVDGGLYGDTKLYYSTDVLKSRVWLNDAEASNLLAINRPKNPEVQAIELNIFRQVDVTVDQYLTKQAFKDEMAFAQFISVTLGWLSETKRVHDGTTYNTFIGTDESSTGGQSVTVDVTTAVGSATGEEANRLEASAIAESLANLMVKMGDYSRAYNDYQHLRSYSQESLKVVWNSSFVNRIQKRDLPTIFHKDFVDKLGDRVMPSRYFGVVITSSNVSSYSDSTPAAGKPIDSDDGSYVPGSNNANGTIRSMIETDVTVSSTTYHLFPGDELPAGATIGASKNFAYGDVYIEDPSIICKIYVVLPPFMSAFEVGTSFFNARSLTTNHYLTWGRNTLEHLKNYPVVTMRKA